MPQQIPTAQFGTMPVLLARSQAGHRDIPPAPLIIIAIVGLAVAAAYRSATTVAANAWPAKLRPKATSSRIARKRLNREPAMPRIDSIRRPLFLACPASSAAARCHAAHRIVMKDRMTSVRRTFKADDLRLVRVNVGVREAFIVHHNSICIRLCAAFVAALLAGLVAAAPSILAAGASDAASDASASSVPSETANRVHVVDVRRDDAKGTLAVTLRIDSGFHINANPASDKYLIPTSLNVVGDQPVRVAYPPPAYFKPKFADDRIAVYEGTVVITAVFARGALRHLALFGTTVTAQACTDAICFPPADLPVRIPKPAVD